MIPEYVLRQRLMENPDFVALVGARVFPTPRTQTGETSKLPAVVYQRVGGLRFLEHDGPSRFARARIQYSCFANTDREAWAVANTIRKTLDGWSNRESTPWIDSVQFPDEPVPEYENDTKIHHVPIDAVVVYGD